MFEWIIVGAGVGFVAFIILRPRVMEAYRLRRAEYIRTYKLPRGLLNKLSE